eukprot:2430653-Rhodomonas_salina.1
MADPPYRQGSTLDEALSAAAVSELDQTPDTLERAQSTCVTAVLRKVEFVEYLEGGINHEDQAIANAYLQAEFGCDLSTGA